MTREQIIKIMRKGFEEMAFRESSQSEKKYFKESADAILALPLDVLSDEDISTTAYDYCMFEGGEEGEPEADPETYRHFRDGMNCMRDEIIKRNK